MTEFFLWVFLIAIIAVAIMANLWAVLVFLVLIGAFSIFETICDRSLDRERERHFRGRD